MLDLFSGGLVALLGDLQGSTRPLVGTHVVGIKHGYNALCSRIIFSRNSPWRRISSFNFEGSVVIG